MSAFDEAFKFTLAREKGYVNDPDDPGGETDDGVTLNVWRAWLKQTGKGQRPLRSITPEDERSLYHDLYWQPYGLDDVCAPWAIFIFDAAVNLRSGVAVRLAQAVLFVGQAFPGPIDGKLGQETLDAMNAHPELAPNAAYSRIGYHVARTNPKFIKGVLNRCRLLAKAETAAKAEPGQGD